MEFLYESNLCHSKVHAVTWSGMNLVALSVSVHTEGAVTESYKKSNSHQLLVFDPNRPWDFHCVAGESKNIVKQLDWSLDSTRLLSLSDNGIVHVWRMKSHSINSWVAAHKQDTGQGAKVVHTSWLDCRPMATINHTKEDWNEAMEFQGVSPQLRLLLGEAFISVTTDGKVVICSTSLPHCEPTGELVTDTTLPGSGLIRIANTFVTQTGSILLGVGYQGGMVKVYSLAAHLHWINQFTITASLATELHNFEESGKISDMLMLPHADGCMVHVCYNNSQLYQWSVKDITRSGSYQSRREGVYSSPHPISSLAGSRLCLGSHDLSIQEQKMSELLVLDVDLKEGEGRWPVEVLLTIGQSGELTVLDRDSYKEIHVEILADCNEMEEHCPAPKKQRLGCSGGEGPLLCLSPNSCCVLVVNGNTLRLYQIASAILALKDPNASEAPRCSRLLSLAVVSSLSPWDIAVSCSRLQVLQGTDFVRKVLEHFSADYENHSSTLKDLVVRQFFTACSLLHVSMEEGLLPSLSYRNMARLYATRRLVELNLSPSSPEQGMPRLQAVCKDNKMEENLNNLAEDLDPKDFALSTEVASHLQPHCHWMLELAIQIVAAIAEGEVHVNTLLGRSIDGVVMDTDNTAASDENPSPLLLDLLRQLLLLVYVWNKSLTQPVASVSNGGLALLFKVLTVFSLSPQSPLSDELQSEVKSNVSRYEHPHLLTLTRAAQLQGFLSGLCSANLPESFWQGVSAPLRPHVQSHYTSLDPYSPLALVVPPGMAPPWRDCFTEGQRDLVHGGTLSKAVVQSARLKLKQCSRCRSWTLTSDKLNADQTASSQAVMQWRSVWTCSCLCGAPWTLHNTNGT